jgi:hypothetical protein
MLKTCPDSFLPALIPTRFENSGIRSHNINQAWRDWDLLPEISSDVGIFAMLDPWHTQNKSILRKEKSETMGRDRKKYTKKQISDFLVSFSVDYDIINNQ